MWDLVLNDLFNMSRLLNIPSWLEITCIQIDFITVHAGTIAKSSAEWPLLRFYVQGGIARGLSGYILRKLTFGNFLSQF